MRSYMGMKRRLAGSHPTTTEAHEVNALALQIVNDLERRQVKVTDRDALYKAMLGQAHTYEDFANEHNVTKSVAMQALNKVCWNSGI